MRLQRHELAVSAPIADKATTPTPLLLVVRSHGYRAERSRRPAAGPGLVSSKGPPMLGDDARPCPPKVRAQAEGLPATPPPARAGPGAVGPLGSRGRGFARRLGISGRQGQLPSPWQRAATGSNAPASGPPLKA